MTEVPKKDVPGASGGPGRSGKGLTGALAIIGMAAILRKHVDATLAPLDMSVRKLSVLGHVRSRPGISITDLAKRASITTQSMHATVHDLIAAEMLASDGPMTRGRSGSLHITPSGRQRLEAALNEVAEIDQSLELDRLDSAEMTRIAYALVKSQT